MDLKLLTAKANFLLATYYTKLKHGIIMGFGEFFFTPGFSPVTADQSNKKALAVNTITIKR
jgi:hypothetical protein